MGAADYMAGLNEPVHMINNFSWGGYLIYSGVPVLIDGRADMYGDAFLKEYREGLLLAEPNGLQKLLEKHRIAWTILEPGSAAVTLLDHLPQWRRIYADKTAVVHVSTTSGSTSVDSVSPK